MKSYTSSNVVQYYIEWISSILYRMYYACGNSSVRLKCMNWTQQKENINKGMVEPYVPVSQIRVIWINPVYIHHPQLVDRKGT